MTIDHWAKAALMIALLISLAPRPAWAYIGPGTGLSAIGAFLALTAGIFVAIFGFLWYPIKKLLRKRKSSPSAEHRDTPE